ncbi:MAG TPA: MFS transporter [Pirellulales bacterium]|jgi:MFS family permease|nr:MFS transporter [Pirellulales bacterium]
MDWRNRIGLYGAYGLGLSGIGFTLPYLPLYLGEKGLSDTQISLISALAAVAGLAQFPLGLWSDRLQWRKPFLVASLGVLAVATFLLPRADSLLALGALVVLFAENGICRAVLESLAGAEAASLAPAGQVGAAMGALRFWKPVAIVSVTLIGGFFAERFGVGSILAWLVVVQGLAFAAALLIHDRRAEASSFAPRDNAFSRSEKRQRHALSRSERRQSRPRWDRSLWAFIAAMVLFHACNAPGGVYLGLFMDRELQAPAALLSYAFVVSMVAWMLLARPAGRLADRWGRRPLLIFAWAVMALRLALIAVVRSPWEVVAIQVLDGTAGGLFSILCAAWVTDKLGDARRVGEAQVIVGTSLVLGSALGPAVSGPIAEALGYRGLFALLAGVGALATAVVVIWVPETLKAKPIAGLDAASELVEAPHPQRPSPATAILPNEF